MAPLRRLFLRIGALFRHRGSENELAREIAAHLALLEDEHRRRGLASDDARLAARRAMGSVAHAKDLHRDARSFRWMDDLRHDLRHAAGALRRTPGLTLLAVVSLGLGIGVNTTFFTLVNAICLRGLPIESPDRVMYVSTRDAQDRTGSLSYAEFDALRARTAVFTQVAAYAFTVAAVGDNRQPPARVPGAYISAGAFELLGDRPILGRTFRPDEDRPGGPAVVILGSEIWSSRYAEDPSIVGQSITVNGIPSTVVGVMPRGFMFPSNADLWRPMAELPVAVRQSRAERRLAVFARLGPGATVEQARGDAAGISAAWAQEFTETNRGVRLHVVPINEQLNPSVTQRAWLAFITAGALVLLVSCANVANLLLMRGAARSREMAIRASIGATRARVARQLLAESAVLAALAGLTGVALAWAALRGLAGIVPPETLPYWMAFAIDARVLAVTLAVCAGCVLLCGLPSALHVSKADLRATATGEGATTFTRPSRRWIGALLAAEFAVSLVLISVAVMSVRASAESRRTEFQIDADSLLTMWVTLPGDSYGTPAAHGAFFERLHEAVGGSVAIGSVALASALPYGGGRQQPVSISGAASDRPAPVASTVSISERYFAVLRIPLVIGRAFTAADGLPGQDAAIVNGRFVEMFLAGRNPIGTRIRIGSAESAWLTIVGVATAVRQQVVGAEPDPVVFLPLRASPPQTAAILVRTAGEPTGPVTLLRTEVARIDPNLPLYQVMSFEQAVRNALWNGRLSDIIVKSIATVALALALVGLYAVVGHTVERWRRELGVRRALGAKTRQIGWLVTRRVLTQLSTGLAAGVVGTMAFDRTFNDQTGPVSMTDPAALGATVVAIAAVAVLACVVPIRRAARVDPLVALRAE